MEGGRWRKELKEWKKGGTREEREMEGGLKAER